MPKRAGNGPQSEEEKSRSLTVEQELIRRYPNLKKKTSEFFKASAVRYGSLVKTGVPPVEAMVIAAEETAAQVIPEYRAPGLDA